MSNIIQSSILFYLHECAAPFNNNNNLICIYLNEKQLFLNSQCLT